MVGILYALFVRKLPRFTLLCAEQCNDVGLAAAGVWQPNLYRLYHFGDEKEKTRQKGRTGNGHRNLFVYKPTSVQRHHSNLSFSFIPCFINILLQTAYRLKHIAHCEIKLK